MKSFNEGCKSRNDKQDIVETNTRANGHHGVIAAVTPVSPTSDVDI
jgi:hypothetical protein